MSRLRHLGWDQCSPGLPSRPLESCHHQRLKALCGVLVYPTGAATELLDGTLELGHCTRLFTKSFSPSPPGLYPGLVGVVGVGKRSIVTSKNLVDGGGNFGKRVRLRRKTRPSFPSSWQSGARAFNAEAMEKIAPPLTPQDQGERWAWLAIIFFLDLGLGEVLLRGTPGICPRRQQA